MKTCKKCGVAKSKSSFGKREHGKEGLQSRCTECTNLHTKAVKYGVSERDLITLFESAKVNEMYRCSICMGLFEKIAIDHDRKCCPHSGSCGKCIRGLLCGKCNGFIAAFNDDIETLNNAMAYVRLGELRSLIHLGEQAGILEKGEVKVG